LVVFVCSPLASFEAPQRVPLWAPVWTSFADLVQLSGHTYHHSTGASNQIFIFFIPSLPRIQKPAPCFQDQIYAALKFCPWLCMLTEHYYSQLLSTPDQM
jgi:hypothetical protein